jgi:hypothetical protein
LRAGFRPGGRFVGESFEALELLHGAAEKAFGLRLIAQELRESSGLAKQAAEALGQTVAAILGLGDLDIVRHVVVEEDEGPAVGIEGLVEARGIESAFDAGTDEERLLGESGAFDGEELLGIGGLVAGDEVGAEVVDDIELFDANDREVAALEGVAAFDLGICFGVGGRFLGHCLAFRDELYHAGGRDLRGGTGRELNGKEIAAANCRDWWGDWVAKEGGEGG